MPEKLLTRNELAKQLGAHPQTIAKWTAGGMPVAVPGRPGVAHKYREAEARAWLKARESSDAGRAVDLTAARTRRELAQARRTEHHLAKERGELVEAEAWLRLWEGVIVTFRDAMLALPGSLAGRLVRAASLGENEVASILDEAIRRELDILSRAEKPELPAPPEKKKKRPPKATTPSSR